jgi:hypothetical protein
LVSHQSHFHQRWRHLGDPHVRALAWLLDAPALLDPKAPQWHGKVATLGPVDDRTISWLNALDQSPQSLHAEIDRQPHKRLGRYAEQLLAFYLREHGMLAAHGLQVRTDRGNTLGEFDFLLPDGDGLLHWEIATKLYLLDANGDAAQANDYVGPNLADTLGLKLEKILHRQLSLGSHPAARQVLPKPIRRAQALIKGWLFYQGTATRSPAGISSAHCRGFWCDVKMLRPASEEQFLILQRLAWLAPAKVGTDALLDAGQLRQALREAFAHVDAAPVLIARMERLGNEWLEQDRGFIVPEDWKSRSRNWIRQAAPGSI